MIIMWINLKIICTKYYADNFYTMKLNLNYA